MTKEKYLDKNGKELVMGFYIDESPQKRGIKIPIYFFTGKFDIENGFPIFSFFNGYKGENLESYNEYFCEDLRPVDEHSIENKIECLEEELNIYKENLSKLKTPTTN